MNGHGQASRGSRRGPRAAPARAAISEALPRSSVRRAVVLGLALSALAVVALVVGGGSRVAMAATDPDGCLGCHAYPLTTTFQGEQIDLQVDSDKLEASPHKDVPCSLCHTTNHGSLDQIRATAYQTCRTCHAGSAPGAPGTFSHPDPPLSCDACHGPIHAVVPASDPASPLNKAGDVEFCGGCHPDQLAAYDYSYHGSAHRLGSENAPVCADCHAHAGPVQPATSAGGQEAAMEQATSSCATCHRSGSEALAALVAAGPEHVTPLDRDQGIDGSARWIVWKFFLLLILFNVTKDGAVVALDLTRRLRGNRGRGGHAQGGKGGRS